MLIYCLNICASRIQGLPNVFAGDFGLQYMNVEWDKHMANPVNESIRVEVTISSLDVPKYNQ